MEKCTVLRVAVPVPLRRLFDYLPPAPGDGALPGQWVPGLRVRVPFGRQKLVGVVVGVTDTSDVPADRLKPVLAVLDREPVLPPGILAFIEWAARYYFCPPGEAFQQALPVLLREGGDPGQVFDPGWQLTATGREQDASTLANAPARRKLLEILLSDGVLSKQALTDKGVSAATIRALKVAGWIEAVPLRPMANLSPQLAELPPALNEEQAQALAGVAPARFGAYLLEGVTGSGKTEVYLRLIERELQAGRQALVLVPEIGLTPQTVARFRQRFTCAVTVLHSGLNERERLRGWLDARDGRAGIVIGTRSALLVPLARPGILIVDEEHDSSFRQQDGFRYSARDLAVVRAQQEGIPVVLGSATPSLETVRNAMEGHYTRLALTQRAGTAEPPRMALIDVRGQALDNGLSRDLVDAIRETLSRGEQVLVFINRRGFSPALVCSNCGWMAQCPHCDVRLTAHKRQSRLRCHHCDYSAPLPSRCPQCLMDRLDFVGVGTQRSEERLQALFPDVPVLRVDRDTTQRRHAMAQLLERIHAGGPCLLVGTQMLAKGHHFPDVTLVAILDTDQGMFSADFRGVEKTAQLIVQVAGRAGRAGKPGTVFLQSLFADHPVMQTLVRDGYLRLSRQLLQERRLTHQPPWTHLAVIRAEHRDAQRAADWLRQLREQAATPKGVEMIGPVPALMERKAGVYRYEIFVRASTRPPLHACLQSLCRIAEEKASGMVWNITVDPG